MKEYSVNGIAENLLNMADSDGWDTGLFEDIEDLRSNESIAFPCDQGFTETLL